MPIYLYQCGSCGVQFERLQRMSDEPLTDCPECDGQVRRVIQPVGIIFKGSGFYVTDNRSGSSSTLAPTKEKTETAGGKDAESSTADSSSRTEDKTTSDSAED